MTISHDHCVGAFVLHKQNRSSAEELIYFLVVHKDTCINLSGDLSDRGILNGHWNRHAQM